MTAKAQRHRILMIDDMPVNLQVLSAALASDFQIQVATSGALGLALAAKTPPDLILFLLFSNGVTEARNAQGEQFGLERLSGLFDSGIRGPPCSCVSQIASIRQALQLFSDSAQVSDDQTLFMIELASRIPEGHAHD